MLLFLLYGDISTIVLFPNGWSLIPGSQMSTKFVLKLQLNKVTTVGDSANLSPMFDDCLRSFFYIVVACLHLVIAPLLPSWGSKVNTVTVVQCLSIENPPLQSSKLSIEQSYHLLSTGFGLTNVVQNIKYWSNWSSWKLQIQLTCELFF